MIGWFSYFFDAVLSTQVIEHNRLEHIKEIIKEINRVTIAGGYFFAMVKKYPPRDDWKKGKFVRLDGHLYAPTEGTEKGVLHYFFAEDEFKDVWVGFNIIDIKEDKKRQDYCILSQKAGLGCD